MPPDWLIVRIVHKNGIISGIVLQYRHNQNWAIKQHIQFLKNAKPKDK